MKLIKVIVWCFIYSISWSCGSNQPVNQENTDAVGQEAADSPFTATETSDLITASTNGESKEFKFVDTSVPLSNHLNFTSPTTSIVRMERCSSAKAKEKMSLLIVNYDLDKLTYPYKVPQKNTGKQMTLRYEVQKSNIMIPYQNVDDFELELSEYKNDILEGTFSGTVKNAGNRTIKIENGKFRVKIIKQPFTDSNNQNSIQ